MMSVEDRNGCDAPVLGIEPSAIFPQIITVIVFAALIDECLSLGPDS
jgi:hypothetical protein